MPLWAQNKFRWHLVLNQTWQTSSSMVDIQVFQWKGKRGHSLWLKNTREPVLNPTMISPPNTKLNKTHCNGTKQSRLCKMPIYVMTFLLWTPPGFALKNSKLLNIIKSYHIVVNLLWLAGNFVVGFANYQSKLYVLFPKIYLFLLFMFNAMQTYCNWYFLCNEFNKKKQVSLWNTLKKTMDYLIWPPKYVILLHLLLLCALAETALIAFTEVQLWSVSFITYMLSFLGDNFPQKVYINIYILLRIYHTLGFFMYIPYLVSLCLAINTLLNQCWKTISLSENFTKSKFQNQLCETMESISHINSHFEVNNSVFLIVAVNSVMIWLYFGIVFRECYSYWIYAQVACFATTLASFLWTSSTPHSKVRTGRKLKHGDPSKNVMCFVWPKIIVCFRLAR